MNTPPRQRSQRRTRYWRSSLSTLLCAVASLIALCPTVGAADNSEPLGRLFFTPERRQMLDRLRQLNIQEKQEIPEDTSLTINGVVTRSSGRRTVWINGVSQNENDPPGSLSVTPNRKDPGQVILQSSEAPAANARVGDTVNRNTGEASDLLGDGRIGVHRGTAK
ncbi:hypothetical protein [Propionivibrio sp.]|uniref:hypothetical protein n=2 Tax=Propionivibrio sp. TaxID=2212460 RepID=UPI0025D4F174|nr:hypothetical protein [Propionivibrio sp.]MBK7357419.1 hypothetical protein [Propionivibrio sp.]MBK8399843.1 hypothetical protein [Propionivibrio sp.]MBK8743267.1 hypothetical protein [Propionivibrio sp.]MBK8894718.1 hypothetical protein [Propionivibrio sp.]MBL0207202.1 hypothetical protein [Propionivibrio sp.]